LRVAIFSIRDLRETGRQAVLREVDDGQQTSCFLQRSSKSEAGFAESLRIFDQQIDNCSRILRHQKRADGDCVEDPVCHGFQQSDPLFRRQSN
jgi:hypothetical protein